MTSATRVVQSLFPAGLVARVNGQIADLWYGIGGGHTSVLGLPTTDEIPLAGGAGSRFEGGRIYWSPRTGAHSVVGQILGAWGAHGYERGILGYPTSDPHTVAEGTRVDVQHGSLTLRSDGAVVRESGTVVIAARAPATAARTPATPSTSPATPSPAAGSTPSPTPTTTAPTAAPSGTPATSAPESTPTDGTP